MFLDVFKKEKVIFKNLNELSEDRIRKVSVNNKILGFSRRIVDEENKTKRCRLFLLG